MTGKSNFISHMSEETKNNELMEGQDLEALFSSAQETIEEAKERRAQEEARFAKTKYFMMDKDKTYKIRVLPLPPNSARRGYEHPVHEIMLKLKNPKNGKIRWITCCRATEAGMSIDLIDTYRKKALALAKEEGDEALVEKLRGGTFGGGIGYDYKHAMYVYDLTAMEEGLQLWKASNGQFKALEDAKMACWRQIIEATGNSKQPCPLSSWNAAYAMEITKKKGAGGRTEYGYAFNNFKMLDPLTREQLQQLIDATPIPNIVYRFTKFQLEAEIIFLQQYDEDHDLGLMDTDEVKEAIEKLKGELPADDTTGFSFGSEKEDGSDSGDDDEVTFETIANAFDHVIESGHKEKSEEMMEVRNMIIDYIQRKQLNVKIMRTKTTENLLDEVESCLQDMDGEPEDKPQAKTVKVEAKVDPAEDNGTDDQASSKEAEPEGDGDRNFDTNEPAAPSRRRRRTEN